MAESDVQGDGTEWRENALRRTSDVEAKRQVWEAAVELRDRALIVDVDHGHGIREVASAYLLSPSRVMQILARKG